MALSQRRKNNKQIWVKKGKIENDYWPSSTGLIIKDLSDWFPGVKYYFNA